MSSSFIYEFSSAATRTPSASPRSSTAPIASIRNSLAEARAVEIQPGSPEANSLGCVRGICAAFVLEGGMALVVYGIWRLWQLAH